MTFPYKCPDCGTTNRIHDRNCKYEFTDLQQFERCYVDILSVLMSYAGVMESYELSTAMKKELLIQKVQELPDYSQTIEEDVDLESVDVETFREEAETPTQAWTGVHEDCLDRLNEERHIMETPEGLLLVSPEERAEQVIPNFEPLKTIYETGPVNGAKDYSVYTMVSWCALKEMTWEQTCNFLTEWLEETNAWERESWGEGSIQELLNDKRHVWRNDLGWGEMAEIAKREIDDSDVEPQIDAGRRVGREADEYDD